MVSLTGSLGLFQETAENSADSLDLLCGDQARGVAFFFLKPFIF